MLDKCVDSDELIQKSKKLDQCEGYTANRDSSEMLDQSCEWQTANEDAIN